MTVKMYKTKLTPVNKIELYEGHARNHTEEGIQKLMDSISEFGLVSDILVDADGVVLGGVRTLEACKRLQMEKVPVKSVTGLTNEQIRVLRLALQRLPEDSTWDTDRLATELRSLESTGTDLGLTGFSPDELTSYIEVIDEEQEEGAPPKLPTEAVSVPGDVWVLGDHRLICGSATDLAAVELVCDGQLVDQVVTDPPPNVEKTDDAPNGIGSDSLTDEDFLTMLQDSFVNMHAVMKPGAAFYIWHADTFGFELRQALRYASLQERQVLVWKKNQSVIGKLDFHWKHESAAYGWKEGDAHLWANDRKQSTILEFDMPQSSELHPTMKPVDLIEYLILNNTKGKDIVLDLFGGSGTTLIAAERLGRICRMVELDPKYVDVIIMRWQEFTGRSATLVDGKKKPATFQKVKGARNIG